MTTQMPTTTDLIQQICDHIAANLDDDLTLEALGATFNLSPTHLQRTFKRVTGITPRQYTDACRIGRFKAGLRDGDSVTAAIYDAGFGSSSRLYERCDDALGMTPSTYRKGGDGMTIRYTVTPYSMGWVLVAATERGICKIGLEDKPDTLIKLLYDEYPAAEITTDGEGLGDWVKAILSYLQGWQPHLDLPLDIRATAFQHRVWEELRRIPYGETRSYAEIAQAIGQPTAYRAVARACATNPVAPVIPCHRVVRTDGGLGGYRWDIKRKRALLDMEQQDKESST